MTTSITVDLGGAVPPYEQIRRQVSSLIAVGELVPGDRLPTVRALAADLGVAVGTVGRAYRELESAGLIESRRRLGTIVASAPTAHAPAPPEAVHPREEGTAVVPAASGHPQFDHALDTLLAAAAQTPFDDETIVDMVRGRLMLARRPSAPR